MSDQMRKDFESWKTKRNEVAFLARSHEGFYFWERTEKDWQVWRAALAAKAPEIKIEVSVENSKDAISRWNEFAGREVGRIVSADRVGLL